MAILPESLAIAQAPPAPKGKNAPPASSSVSSILYGYHVETPVIRHERGTGLSEGKVETTTGVPTIVHEQMVHTLSSQLQNLLKIQQQDAAIFNDILNDPNHQNEARLLEMVTKNGRVDNVTISNMLKLKDEHGNYPGLQMAMTALDTMLSRQMMAAGIGAELRNQQGWSKAETPANYAKITAVNRTDLLGIKSGKYRRFVGGTPRAARSNIGLGLGAGIAGAVAGWFGAGTITATVAGGAAGPLALYGAMKGVGELGKSLSQGYHIDQKGFALGLAYMQQPQQRLDREIMIRAYGVDPTDFVVDADGNVQLNAAKSGINYRTANVERLQRDLFQLMSLRLQIHESLGEPLKDIHAFPEQSFHTSTRDGRDSPREAMLRREKSTIDYAQRIDRRMQELIANRGNLSNAELLALKLEARQQVFGELLETTTIALENSRDVENKQKHLRRLGLIEKQYTHDETNPEAKDKRISAELASNKSRKELLDREKTSMEGIQSKAKEYIDSTVNIRRLYREIQQRFGTNLNSLEAIDAEITRREGISVEELTRLKNELQEALQAVESVRFNGDSIDRDIDSIIQAYHHFTDPQEIGLTDADFINRDLDSILARINTLHEEDIANNINPPRGWPASENANQNNRISLLNARIEARVRTQYADIVSGPGQNEVEDLIEVGFTRNEIRTLTLTELRQRQWAIADNSGGRHDRMTNEELITAITRERNLFEVSTSLLSRLKDEESNWRTTHNNSIEQRRAGLDRNIESLSVARDELQAAENKLTELVQPRKLADAFLRENFADYETSRGTINAFAAQTAGTAYDLSPDIVRNLSFEEVIRRINSAAANQVPGAWEKSANMNRRKITAVLAYIAEAKAAQSQSIVTMPDALNLVLQSGISESELYNDSPEARKRVFNNVDNFLRQNPNLRPPQFDQNTISNAFSQAQSRFDMRVDNLAGTLTDALNAAMMPNASVEAQVVGNAAQILLEASPDSFKRYEAQRQIYIQRATVFRQELHLRDLPNARRLQQNIDAKRRELNGLDKYEDNGLSDQLESMQTRIRDYKDKLTALNKKRQEVVKVFKGQSVSGDITLEEVTQIVSAAEHDEKNPVDELRRLRGEIVNVENKSKSGGQEVRELASTFESGKAAYLNIVQDVNNALVNNNRTDVTPDDVAGAPLDWILQRINEAHGLDPSVGWPGEQNDQHFHEVLLARAEAGLRVAPHIKAMEFVTQDKRHMSLFEDDEPVEIVGLHESDFYTLNERDILERINEAHRRGVTDAWAETENTRADILEFIQDLKNFALQRMEVRVRSQEYQQIARELQGQIDGLAMDRERMIESMRHNREFVQIVKDLAERRNDLFAWANEFTGPMGRAREAGSTQYIDVNDETVPHYVRFDAANNRRLIPRGAWEMYNTLIGDIEEPIQRRQKFETLINHPQFNPQALAEKLNRALHLGLGQQGGIQLNIDSVFVAIQQRLNNNPLQGPTQFPPVNQITFYRAIRSIIREDMQRALAL